MMAIVFFALPILLVLAGLQADKHYRHMHTMGRQDAILHQNRSDKLSGLNQWSYRRGHAHQQSLLVKKQ